MADPVTMTTSGLEIVDDLSAPTILVDSFSGVLATGGVVTFGCTQTILDVESDSVMTPKKKVVLRLAIPAGSLPGIAKLLKDQEEQMIKDGVLRQAPMDSR